MEWYQPRRGERQPGPLQTLDTSGASIRQGLSGPPDLRAGRSSGPLGFSWSHGVSQPILPVVEGQDQRYAKEMVFLAYRCLPCLPTLAGPEPVGGLWPCGDHPHQCCWLSHPVSKPHCCRAKAWWRSELEPDRGRKGWGEWQVYGKGMAPVRLVSHSLCISLPLEGLHSMETRKLSMSQT